MNDAFGLEKTCVLVTGGTRGIGKAISLRLARAGATVVANYARNETAAAALKAEALTEHLPIEVMRADLTLPKGMASVRQRMQTCGDSIVSVVHCAATGVHRPLDELTLKHWDWTIALNARVFFELVRGLSTTLSDGSAIVAVSSAGAVRAVPAYTLIGASKGALESTARHMAIEMAPRGIRVNILSPGSVETASWDAFPDKERRLAEAVQRAPLGRLVTADEVAYGAQFLCSRAARGMVGQTLVIDGGTRILE
jgi:enoyl-[acyl-carrier protein] reductase III